MFWRQNSRAMGHHEWLLNIYDLFGWSIYLTWTNDHTACAVPIAAGVLHQCRFNGAMLSVH